VYQLFDLNLLHQSFTYENEENFDKDLILVSDVKRTIITILNIKNEN